MSINIFSNLQNLAGIGDKLASFLSRLVGGNRIVDLLYHQPSQILPKKFLPLLYEIKNKELIIAKVKVESHLKGANSRQPFRVRCFSPSGYLTCVFFKTFPSYIEKNFPIGSEIVVSGTAERFNDELQIAHPDYVFPANEIYKIPKSEIVYPTIAAFSQKFIRSKIAVALKSTPDLPEWIDENLLKQQGWKSWKESIFSLHHDSRLTTHDSRLSSRRLAFDELLAEQIAKAIAKKEMQKQLGNKIVSTNILRNQLLKILPFELTDGQKKVLSEIDDDLASNKKMLRLLQGDVGSGKTIVAFLAILAAVENKKQAAIIVPIALLALQHFKNLNNFAEQISQISKIKIAVLTSKTTKKNRDQILQNLKNGEIDILIGTHSLLEPDVVFKDLALIVIDEQHRFGVVQRLKLVEKSNNADVLLMSATPIPRSLMMTLYGDMEISILREKPYNRVAIDTRIISQNKEEEVFKAISRAIENGEKIYWICPLIEDLEARVEHSAEDDLSNVNNRYAQFQKIFGQQKVGLIHGRMKEREKNQVMEEFAFGSLKILVATTVIEVGIDVSDATIIIIENAEQFGLSQLHQLRGRVGRGQKQSYCILLYGKKIGQNGKKRMNIMRQSNDGFFIAEEDLKLRGSGEMLGTKQSGLPDYKMVDLNFDLDLFLPAKHNAQLILNRGFSNDSPAGILMKIFGLDDCIKMVKGG